MPRTARDAPGLSCDACQAPIATRASAPPHPLPQVPGDGRELVVALEDCVKVRQIAIWARSEIR